MDREPQSAAPPEAPASTEGLNTAASDARVKHQAGLFAPLAGVDNLDPITGPQRS